MFLGRALLGAQACKLHAAHPWQKNVTDKLSVPVCQFVTDNLSVCQLCPYAGGQHALNMFVLKTVKLSCLDGVTSEKWK